MDAPANYDHPTPRQSEWIDEASWRMPFSEATHRDSFFGGHFDSLKVWAKPIYNGIEGHIIERGIPDRYSGNYEFYIVGEGGSLDHNVLTAYVNALTGDGQERLMLEAVAQTESNFRHFAAGTPGGTSINGYPLESGDHGYGIMQLTAPPPTRIQIWNWQANIDRALTGYVRPCWNAGSNWLNNPPGGGNPGVIADEMRRLETYARYRGGTNPNNVDPMTYHEWCLPGGGSPPGSVPHWRRRPVICGCAGDRAGQWSPGGDCFDSIICHADVALRNEGP